MISKEIRKHGGQIVEMNPTYTIVTKRGMTEDIMSLYHALNDYGCVLQYVRSGRIAVTKSCIEYLDRYLAERKEAYDNMKKQQAKESSACDL